MEDVIDGRTHIQAIQNGMLVDVSAWARRAGITYPTAVTSLVWRDCIVVATLISESNNIGDRLWDVLWTLRLDACNPPLGDGRTEFWVPIQLKPNTQETVLLVALNGLGDELESVITIMLPSEE